MLVFIVVSILILEFFVLPFKITIKGHIDFYSNNGFFKVYLFGIRLFKAHTFIQNDDATHNNIVIEHGKKADQIHINNDPSDKKSIVKIIKNPALRNVLIKKINVDFCVGRKNNAFSTTLLLSSIKITSYALMSFLKCRYIVNIKESFLPKFNEDVLEAEFSSIISISLADIIISTVRDYLKKPLIKFNKTA